MKKLVPLLVLILLAVVPAPAYACQNCQYNGVCGFTGDRYRCRPTIDGCIQGGLCSTSSTAIASEYRIASVEVTHGVAKQKAPVYARR